MFFSTLCPRGVLGGRGIRVCIHDSKNGYGIEFCLLCLVTIVPNKKNTFYHKNQWKFVRKLICWACGQEIRSGKFLHCTACGVNFDEDCFITLTAGLIQQGISRPDSDAWNQRNSNDPPFPSWLSLGKMAGEEIFVKYLLELIERKDTVQGDLPSQVVFQCNSCKVDVDYRLADAELFWRLADAHGKKKSQIQLEGSEIDKFQTISFVQAINLPLKEKFHKLARTSLPDQLEIINKVMGGGWAIDQLVDRSAFKFGTQAPSTALTNQQ